MGLLPFGRNMKRVKQGKPFLIMQTKLPKDLCVSHTHSVLEWEKSVGSFGIFSFMQRVNTNGTDL